jgi:PAS domain S-box-containing protein
VLVKLNRKIVILDKNKNIVNVNELDEDEPLFVKTPNVIEELKKSEHEKVLLNIDDGIDVLIPYNNGEDFVFQNASYHTADFAKVKPCELFNKSYPKSLPYLVDAGFFDVMKKVYKTGESQEITFLYYIDNQIISKFYKVFVKNNDKIYIIIRRESDFSIVHDEGLDLFYNSPDPLIVVQEKKIVRVNKAAEKITGYTNSELIGQDYYFNKPYFNEKTSPEEINEIYMKILNRELFNYTDVLTFKNKDGRNIYTKTTLQPSTYDGKNAVLFNFIDISEGIQHEQHAKRLNEALNLVSEISKIAYMYYDTKNGFIWSEEFFKIIEEKPEDLDGDLVNYVIDKDYEKIRKEVQNSFKNFTSYKTKTKIVTRKGIKDVEIYFNSKNDSKGIKKIFGYVQDITEIVKVENELKYLVNEKESLIGEVHHRVKNNLQIILSLLTLNNRVNPEEPEKTIESTKNRISSMTLVHEQIYQSPDHSHINLKEYILEQYYGIFKPSKRNIKLEYEMEDVYLDLENAMPIGLILSEIMHNTLNYAFPNNQEGNVKITLKMDKEKQVTLTIEDNGIGIPENINMENPNTLGLIVIKNLTKQIEGTIKLLPNKGTGYIITFKN